MAQRVGMRSNAEVGAYQAARMVQWRRAEIDINFRNGAHSGRRLYKGCWRTQGRAQANVAAKIAVMAYLE